MEPRIESWEEEARRLRDELAIANGMLRAESSVRLRAEARLRDFECDSRSILDSIPGFVAVFSPSGDIELLNDRVLAYFGKTLEEVRLWATSDIFHPEDRPHAIKTFGRALASEIPYEFEARMQGSDRVYRWFQLRGVPFRDSAGHVVRWYSLITGIDDLKMAQEAIQDRERNLKVIIDTIPEMAWSAHPDGGAEFLNQHFLDFVRLTADQARGWGWTSAVHPDDLTGLIAAWQGIIASGHCGEAEARLRRNDGEYRWFMFRVNPLRDKLGNIVQWYGANTDIQDRKSAEAGVRRAYGHLSEAQRLSQTGSFTASLERDEHTWSEEFYRICEFEPGSRANIQRLGEIIHPEDIAQYQGAIQSALEGADSRFEFRIVTARGVMKHLRGAAHWIEDVTGPLFVGAIHDVTANKIAEDALNSARIELAHVARLATLSALTASIAHEVNQPLSGIITNASTCLRMLDADPPNIIGARETARRTIRDGNRAADVISRLRALFSKREFTLEPMDLNEATREVIALSLSELRRNRVIVMPELTEDLPPVNGDRIQLQQVLLNLLRNASDAMVDVHDRPRQLVVRTEEEDGDRVRVAVRDSGVGIDRQNADKLFEAFYTTKNGGMGIGLSVSHTIVERHHGRLWAEPNEGPGATFLFSIPRDPRISIAVQHEMGAA